MKISLIVATSENGVIGVENRLPWHLPADLKYFKNLTIGHTIIMGRKTYDSIGKPLPNRKNVVITTNENFMADNVIAVHNVQEALASCQNENEVFIIGGATIYKQTLALAHKVYITKVHVKVENGTAFFPILDAKQWRCISFEGFNKDDKNKFDYAFEVYERVEA